MIKNLIKHLELVRNHRKYVRKACFKMGLYWQGIMHDMSKYSLAELSICKYYNGKKSPHQTCRDAIGYSPSWIHHYHKNKHHFQFWWDESEDGKIIPMKMPYKYVIESFCDMLGASKAYNKDNWQPQMLLDYWNTKCKDKRIMHNDSIILTEGLILDLVYKGENKFFDYYKKNKKIIQSKYESTQYKTARMQIESEYTDFTQDAEKMADFETMTKEDFLASYSYLTEEEYDLTSEACKNKK